MRSFRLFRAGNPVSRNNRIELFLKLYNNTNMMNFSYILRDGHGRVMKEQIHSGTYIINDDHTTMIVINFEKHSVSYIFNKDSNHYCLRLCNEKDSGFDYIMEDFRITHFHEISQN